MGRRTSAVPTKDHPSAMLQTDCGESELSSDAVHLSSIDDLSKSRTVPVKGYSSPRACHVTDASQQSGNHLGEKR